MEWVKVFSTVGEALERINSFKPQLVIIGETRICLVRFKDQFSAVQDSCSHNGVSLSKGHVNFLGEIICPLHNYCFNVKSGREIQGRSRELKTYPIKADETGFFIGI
jgi:3-phenylpropionate/trans-cinnamate dioxygenase ferredoxin subunit